MTCDCLLVNATAVGYFAHYYCNASVFYKKMAIRHIAHKPIMFEVINDKPEGVARGVYRV